ncbi:hypothetical protein XENOCAPTIV_016030, partial [Xenoophorus captivus]
VYWWFPKENANFYWSAGSTLIIQKPFATSTVEKASIFHHSQLLVQVNHGPA